ncbi:hypothetical protein [Terricaulis sp.]|uniref:hypothetical protein n=1 Tax=Terricaulis sp. TaxID=2768686 RepID=UPI003783205F
MSTPKDRVRAKRAPKQDVVRAEEIGQQAVYSLLDLLHSAQEVARMLPREPAAIRVKVMEALAISEIAVLRFKMDLPIDGDAEGVH